jgi:predicted nuclease of predicted toxin-antitoxin system
MRILVGEHIPLMTVGALLLLGHDVRDIRGTPEEGMEDDAQWEIAQREERLLITTDKGFTRYRTDWPGLLVVMRDVAQSTWRARESP